MTKHGKFKNVEKFNFYNLVWSGFPENTNIKNTNFCQIEHPKYDQCIFSLCSFMFFYYLSWRLNSQFGPILISINWQIFPISHEKWYGHLSCMKIKQIFLVTKKKIPRNIHQNFFYPYKKNCWPWTLCLC